MLGMKDVWRPISLQPSKTLVSATSLLPPIAVFLLALTASGKSRAGAAWTIIVVAVASAVLGVIQLSQNDAGGAYFYRITNYGATVGFFSNANHLATLFLSGLVISSEIPFTPSNQHDRRNVLWTTVKWTLVAFFAVNIVVNGSVAGLGLLCAALLYIALRRKRVRALVGRSSSAIAAICVAATGAICVFIWQFSGKLAVFANTSVGADQRLEFASHTVRMIADAFPFGFGLGTFQDVYRNYEIPVGASHTFVNHAHDDYLELLADFGLPAIVLVALFALWFMGRIQGMRRGGAGVSGYCYASAMIVVIVAAHSLFDYPLRTAAIAGVFAFACGCLARPVPKDHQRRVRRSASSRRGDDRAFGQSEFQVTAAVKTDL
jgi:O-antigen ligase